MKEMIRREIAFVKSPLEAKVWYTYRYDYTRATISNNKRKARLPCCHERDHESHSAIDRGYLDIDDCL